MRRGIVSSLRGGVLALTAFASSALTTPALATPMVMVVNSDGLRPVALYDGKKFTAPSRDLTLQKKLGAKLLDQVRELPLYRNGEVQNYFRPNRFEPTPEGCTGSGLWQGGLERKIRRPLLTLSPDFKGSKRYMGNYPDTRLVSVADQFAQKAFRARGFSMAALKRFRVNKRIPFTLNNGTRYFVAVEAEIRHAKNRPCPEANVLLILEKVGRYYRQRLIKYRKNTEDCGTFRFISSFATHKTSNHILVQGLASGARWYDIFAVTQTGFKPRFHGGGHVCRANPSS